MMMDAETVMQWDLRARGHVLWLEAGATTAHTNFRRWRHWVPASFHHARVFGATRAIGWSPAKRLAFTLASPLIPLVRFRRALRHARDAELPLAPAGPHAIETAWAGERLDLAGSVAELVRRARTAAMTPAAGGEEPVEDAA